jgi:hypothetical protein
MLLAALLFAPPASAQLSVAVTQPGHLKPVALWPLDPAQVVHPVYYEPLGSVVLKTDLKVGQAARLEPKLSELCRYGLFHQRQDGRFNAVFGDAKFGAAYGSGAGLYDPNAVADRGRLYLFARTNTTACEVRSVPSPDPRAAG